MGCVPTSLLPSLVLGTQETSQRGVAWTLSTRRGHTSPCLESPLGTKALTVAHPSWAQGNCPLLVPTWTGQHHQHSDGGNALAWAPMHHPIWPRFLLRSSAKSCTNILRNPLPAFDFTI